MQDTSLNIKSLLLNAYDFLKKKNYNEGKILLEKINSINPNIFEVNYNLAIINSQLGYIDTSILFFQKAKKINPNYVSLYNNLGVAYEKKGENNQAIKNYEKAIDVDSKNSLAFFNLGTIYKKENIIDKAENYLKKSIDLNPNFISSYSNLFDLYDRSNQIEKYGELLNKSENFIKDKNIINLYSGIHEYKKKNYKKTIEILKSSNLNENYYLQNIYRSGILAKCYDQIEKFDKAFFYFKKNNELVNYYQGKKIDNEIYIKYIKQRINFFENFDPKKWKDEKVQKDITDPIFLIGFPRSGTTLLDTILRTNSNVDVIEEKPILKNFLIKLEKKTNNKLDALEYLNNDNLREMRLFYFNEREKYKKNLKAHITVDKLPLNIIHVGEILRFFPNAKFIFALRHPYDSVLSCFMQQFELNPAMKNFLSIESSAYLYDLVMKLWKIYMKNFSINFHYIKYEEVVINFETTTKEIFNFLSLDWSDKTKDFYITAKNRKDISTPSYNQVTSPIYLKSLDRWKNYKDYFKGSKKYLDKWVNEFNYEI